MEITHLFAAIAVLASTIGALFFLLMKSHRQQIRLLKKGYQQQIKSRDGWIKKLQRTISQLTKS